MGKKSGKKTIYHVAKTKNDLEQAFSLVYKEYAARGYIPRHYKSKMRLSLHNALPSTTTFVAKRGRRVLASVTLIPDSPIGLPMDKLYKKKLDLLRKRKRRIAECSQLSIDSSMFPRGWFSMFNFNKFIFLFKLFKLIIDYGMQVEKLTDYCIAVNPKHQYLYKFIGFEELGGLKYYGTVNMAPAIAKRLDLTTFEKNLRPKRALHHVFFGYQTPGALKNKYILKPADLEYFFEKRSDIFKKADKKKVHYIESCYKK